MLFWTISVEPSLVILLLSVSLQKMLFEIHGDPVVLSSEKLPMKVLLVMLAAEVSRSIACPLYCVVLSWKMLLEITGEQFQT